jgi:exonuclease SbcD
MRFLHLSDLHLGKRINEFSMIEDQKYILKEIINIIDEKEVQSVLMAGDIYDKSVPSAEAVILLDDFLTELAKRKLKVFIISGNHDSPERIGFGADIMLPSGIYLSKPYDGSEGKITITDEYGLINLYLLPFIKPAVVKHVYKDEEIETYDDAVRVAVEHMDIDKKSRNILIAHQYVSGAEKCDSENVSVGGLDQVSPSHFQVFDYVALGHLHGPQKIYKDYIRYSGTPLKYSFSEEAHKKNALIVDVKEKGNVSYEKVLLKPMHDMRTIRGAYSEITARSFYKDMDTSDYLRVILTDEEDKANAMELLRTIYPNIMQLEYDNRRTGQNATVVPPDNIKDKMPDELFEEFYELQNNMPLNAKQKEVLKELIEKIWESS